MSLKIFCSLKKISYCFLTVAIVISNLFTDTCFTVWYKMFSQTWSAPASKIFLSLVKLLCLVRRRPAEKNFWRYACFCLCDWGLSLVPLQKVIYFQSFQQIKQFEAMGVFHCKISHLFGFPSFSFPAAVAVHPGPSAKVATSSISWREPLRAENMSLLSSACWNESETNCSTAYGSVRALRKSPAPLALGAPALRGVKAEADMQQQATCCWTCASALSSEDIKPNASATCDSWELPEDKGYFARTSLLLGLSSPKRISPRILLLSGWLSQL